MKTDIFYAIENILPIKRMRRVILSITCNCNSRCKTCFIWKKKRKDEMSLDDFRKFAETELFKKIRFLSLTGGEPFLRGDIDEIVNIFKQKNPNLHIAILTNALLPDRIYEKVQKMPKDISISLSLNGNENTHDEIRGVKGNFKKLLETIENLKKLNIPMSFIFTVTKENYNQVLWAWNFAKENNINILFNPEMEYGRLETEKGRDLDDSQKKAVLDQLKKIYSERKRGFFDYTYLLFFKKLYSKKTVTNLCHAGTDSIFIDYNGNIYPCENLVGKIPPFGNIKTDIKIPEDYSKEIRNMKCYENCFLECEMVRNLRKHPIKTIIERNN
ncbi:MAG: radical SAM protein [Candidatus Nanoarchaeia archaeon]|nr:radical SAM protein [Candidatus Nanoarchaeia archaeon]